MNPSNLFIMGLLLISANNQAVAQHGHEHPVETSSDEAPFVVVGKLVDAAWFVIPKEVREGDNQITRATNRMAAGNPAAILPDGTEKPHEIWYLLTDPGPLAPYAGKQIKVEGRAHQSIRAIEVTTLYVRDGEEWREVQIREIVQKGVPPQKAEMDHEAKKEGPPSGAKHKEHGASTGEKHGDHEGVSDDKEGKKDKQAQQHEHGGGTAGKYEKGAGEDHGHKPGLHDLLTAPPAHPILVNFTAGLFPAALLADWLGRLLRRRSLHIAAWWMLLFAAVVTPFTALAGWLWYRQVGDMSHWQMSIHPWLGTSLAILIQALAFWRSRFHVRNEDPSRRYLVCATVLLLALTFQGHLGATMTFSQHAQQSAPAASHAH